MSKVQITKITDRIGNGLPNFTNGFTIAGADSGLSGFTHYTNTNQDGDPTNPANGDTWWNSDTNVYKVYANGAWQTLIGSGGGGSSDVWGGVRGFSIGGNTNGNSQTVTNNIHYFDTTSAGNAIDFGDLTESTQNAACTGNGTRVLRMGGSSPSPRTKTIDYITCATTGNAVDFGDITSDPLGYGVHHGGAVSNGTYAIYVGGSRNVFDNADIMDYVTIATTGNSTDFGDLTGTRMFHSTTHDKTRGVSLGGYSNDSGSNQRINNIDYFTMSTTGNASDFGDLITAKDQTCDGTVSNDTRGLLMGGQLNNLSMVDDIEYITIQTTGNATDFGNLSVARAYGGSCSNETGDKGFSIGGSNGSGGASSYINTIDVVTISTAGNATDFGDGLNNMGMNCGASGNAS